MERVDCECGMTVVKSQITRHKRSLKHQQLIDARSGVGNQNDDGPDDEQVQEISTYNSPQSEEPEEVFNFDSSEEEAPKPKKPKAKGRGKKPIIVVESSSEEQDDSDTESEELIKSQNIEEHNQYWENQIDSEPLDRFLFGLKRHSISDSPTVAQIYNSLLQGSHSPHLRKIKDGDVYLLGSYLTKFERVNRHIPQPVVREYVRSVLNL